MYKGWLFNPLSIRPQIGSAVRPHKVRYNAKTLINLLSSLPIGRNRLQSIIVKDVWYGYLPNSFSTLDELREDCDEQLFFSARYNPYHVLHLLLPQSKNISYDLRKCTHDLTLPTDVNAVMKQNFVFRMLFTDIY